MGGSGVGEVRSLWPRDDLSELGNSDAGGKGEIFVLFSFVFLCFPLIPKFPFSLSLSLLLNLVGLPLFCRSPFFLLSFFKIEAQETSEIKMRRRRRRRRRRSGLCPEKRGRGGLDG